MQRIWRISVFILCLLLACQLQAAPSKNAWQKNINSQQLAAGEVKMWKAYYERNYYELWQSLIVMLSEQFNISRPKAAHLSGSVVQAALRFGQMPKSTKPERYINEVLPDITHFYRGLKQALGTRWQPRQLAMAELNWWLARRTRGKNSPRAVGKKIAKLYSLIYRRNNAAIRKAGYLRAKAANLRDRQARKGKKYIKWKQIERILRQSYQQLARGVR